MERMRKIRLISGIIVFLFFDILAFLEMLIGIDLIKEPINTIVLILTLSLTWIISTKFLKEEDADIEEVEEDSSDNFGVLAFLLILLIVVYFILTLGFPKK